MLADLKRRAKRFRRQTYALYLAARHPDTPWYARLLATFVAAYALSPIDLIPDFIPVLGYLDDLIIVPAGIALSIRLIPEHVMEESEARAEEVFAEGKPVSRGTAFAVVIVWLAAAVLLGAWAWRLLHP